MTNAYPELAELPYERTVTPMTDIIAYLGSVSLPTEVKRSTYIITRNESSNGTAGVNNNLAGFQGDGARWPDKWTPLIAGTVTEPENGTGRTRIFLAFYRWQTSIDMLAEEVTSRGLYVNGTTVPDDVALAQRYYREWVTGNPAATLPDAVRGAFTSMYGQAMALFRDNATLASDPARSDPPRVVESEADKLMDAEQQQINRQEPTT